MTLPTDERIEQVRRFERFYERHLRQTLRSIAMEDFSLADARVVHEMSLFERGVSGACLGPRLGLDAGYLCRIFKKLEACGLLESWDSPGDGRCRDWGLTARGRRFSARIESHYRSRVRDALEWLREDEQRRLVEAMRVIEEILGRNAVFR